MLNIIQIPKINRAARKGGVTSIHYMADCLSVKGCATCACNSKENHAAYKDQQHPAILTAVDNIIKGDGEI